jgi:hypothetical protein
VLTDNQNKPNKKKKKKKKKIWTIKALKLTVKKTVKKSLKYQKVEKGEMCVS